MMYQEFVQAFTEQTGAAPSMDRLDWMAVSAAYISTAFDEVLAADQRTHRHVLFVQWVTQTTGGRQEVEAHRTRYRRARDADLEQAVALERQAKMIRWKWD